MRFKNFLLPAMVAVLLSGCGGSAPVILSTPIEKIDAIPLKYVELTEDEKKRWGHMDLVADTVPGMSIDKAYKEIIKGKKPKKVIVAVIDSGIDIEHEDLRDVVWTNQDEIPNNGKDDDNNGYIDDVHGWNFLGDAGYEQLEMTRIVAQGSSHPQYAAAKAALDAELGELQQAKQQVDVLNNVYKTLSDHLQKEDFTKEEVQAIQTEDQTLGQAKAIMLQVLNGQKWTVVEYKKQVKEYSDYVYEQLNYNLNVEFDGRKIVGDDPNNFNDTSYGNNNVIGPDKEDASHGTHVAGIIAAKRNNGKGMDGVANNVAIMTIRAVPDGDEYDKDIALAIRYAVDNGAKVINCSFGKAFSPHPEWVWDAIKYAAEKDVLIVNAAGNDSEDIDVNASFPTDFTNGTEVADNFITIGALAETYGSEVIAGFSNFGANNVDVFAPGAAIYSTIPKSTYDFKGGTSMAAPAVAGLAALIRGMYPSLSAAEVKQVIMDSGLPLKTQVVVGDQTKPFNAVSKSGKIANAYNALIIAAEKAK